MQLGVLYSGNSNAIGRGPGGPDWSLISSHVKTWNDNYDPLTNGDSWVTPTLNALPFDLRYGGNNSGVWLSDYIARLFDVDVKFILAAEGAVPIQAWEPDWLPGYEDCYKHIQRVCDASGMKMMDVFYWDSSLNNQIGQKFHGVDYGLTQSQFHDAVQALRDRLVSDGILHPRGQVLMPGFIFAGSGYLQDAFNDLATEQPSIFHYIYASDLPALDTPPKHFSGDALYTLGGRLFDAYKSHIVNSLPEEQTPTLHALLAAKATATLDAIEA